MENLVKKQVVLGEYITRMWVNSQKLGQARITPTEIQVPLERVDDYRCQFQERHFDMLGQADAEKSDYMKHDTFMSIEKTYFEMREKLSTALAALIPTGAVGQPARRRNVQTTRILVPTRPC